MQAAFAQSIIDSIGGLFEEIIDIEAADAQPAQADASRASPAVKGGAKAAKNADSTSRINTVFEPMRTWYGAPARAALKKKHGKYPATPEALATWKSFGPVTTAFLDDQGVAPGPTAAAPARAASSGQARGVAKAMTKSSPAPAAKKRGLFSKGTQPKPVGKRRAAPAALETTAAASAPAPAKGWLASITGGKRPAAQQARGADATETKAGEHVERKPIGQDSKPVEQPTDKRAKAPAKAPPKKAPPKKQAKPAARKPTTGAPAPAPAAAKKRGLFSKGRAAQPKPVVDESQPAPAPAPARRGLFASLVGAKKLAARKPQFAPASGEAGAADPEDPADEAADPEEINLCYDDSAQGSSARTFLGRTLDIFQGAGALVAREDDTAEVALTEAQEDALRKVFNRVDVSGDGHISVIEAIKALRGARSSTGIEADFARLLGLDDMTRIHQEDGTRDKLMLAFGALDADGDKKLSYEEFRRVVASAATTQDPVLALDP